MKRISILLISFLQLFFIVNIKGSEIINSEKKTLDKVVNEWSDAHNNWDLDKMKNLYASDVLFYCQQIKRDECISKISSLFKPNKVFSQSIDSEIEYKQYPNSIIQASFTKKVKTKNKVSNYPSYLLLYKNNDHYEIIGESDLLTDKNLKFKLDVDNLILPSSNVKPSQMNSNKEENSFFYLILMFLFFTTVGIVFVIYLRNLKKVKVENLQQNEIKLEDNLNKKNTVLIPDEKGEEEHDITLTSVEKGMKFEKYIIEKFDSKYFIQHEWRSDKGHDGIYPTANKKPDMEYEFKFKEHSLRFAIECKYCSNYFNGRIELVERQFNNYKSFSLQEKMPVYITIGVGGSPDNPLDLYLIPLADLKSHIISKETLSTYSKPKTFRFFYNTDKEKLT